MNQLFSVILSSNTAANTADMQQMIMSIGILVVMFVVFYFFLIRPQKKREKELKEQMSKLTVGDEITTIGGVVGRVANIKDDEVTISTSVANTLVTFKMSAIQTVVKRDQIGKAPETKADKKAKKAKEE